MEKIYRGYRFTLNVESMHAIHNQLTIDLLQEINGKLIVVADWMAVKTDSFHFSFHWHVKMYSFLSPGCLKVDRREIWLGISFFLLFHFSFLIFTFSG